MGCIFFFKQKTAYEMRISDWSSDVCSSDLPAETCVLARALERHAATRGTDTYAAFEDGARWSFADTLAHVRTSAAGLQALGVRQEIGRASCRERVCQYVSISVVAAALKNK